MAPDWAIVAAVVVDLLLISVADILADADAAADADGDVSGIAIASTYAAIEQFL